jgi:hypothetical protein
MTSTCTQIDRSQLIPRSIHISKRSYHSPKTSRKFCVYSSDMIHFILLCTLDAGASSLHSRSNRPNNSPTNRDPVNQVGGQGPGTTLVQNMDLRKSCRLSGRCEPGRLVIEVEPILPIAESSVADSELPVHRTAGKIGSILEVHRSSELLQTAALVT